jgi:hypothetical protein
MPSASKKNSARTVLRYFSAELQTHSGAEQADAEF